MRVLFTCSIDDGHPSDLKMAELLARHGLKGTFYLPLKNRERLPVMSPAQMREIGKSFEVGSHTYDHCYLESVDEAEAARQITEGKRKLEDALGQAVKGFCYPGGKYGKKHVEMVRAAGFRYARTVKNLCFDAGSDPFEMPTTVQFYPHSKSVYLRNFAKGGDWAHRLGGLNAALRAESWTGRLYALFDHAYRNGSVFHLWCHSHDIDQVDAWGEMDRFLAYVSGHVSLPNRLDNCQLAERFFS